MVEIKVPSPQAVDAILTDMEETILVPTDCARNARRLRAYIVELERDVQAEKRKVSVAIAMVVHAAGDRVEVHDEHLLAIPDLRLDKRQDPRGSIIYTTRKGS